MDWKLLVSSVLLLLLIDGLTAQEDSQRNAVTRTKLLKSRNLTLTPDGKRRKILKSRVIISSTTPASIPEVEQEELTAELEVTKLDEEDLVTTIARTFDNPRQFQTPAFLITEEPIFEEPEVIVTQKPVRRTTTTATPTRSSTTTPRPKVKKVTTPPSEQVEEERKPHVETVRRFSHTNPDGSFTFGYENADGSFKEETRGTDCVVRGKYGYVDPDGVKREFSYASGNPCVPGKNSEEEDDDSEEEDRSPTTRRPVKVIRKKRPPQEQVLPVREEEDEIDQVLVRGESPIRSPGSEVAQRRPLIRKPTTRQTSPTIPPTPAATENPLKATSAFAFARPTTPSPRAEDIRIRDERPVPQLRPDPFRQRPVIDFNTEVERLEEERRNTQRIPEFNQPEVRVEQRPTPPTRQEPFRPVPSFNFDSEVQRLEQNLGRPSDARPPQPERPFARPDQQLTQQPQREISQSRPEPQPERQFARPDQQLSQQPQREISQSRPEPARSIPLRPEPVISVTQRPPTPSTTTTPRPTVTTNTPRTTASVITSTTTRPSSTTQRSAPQQQSFNRPPFTFFGPVPPEFSQFGPPQASRPQEPRQPVEGPRQPENRPPIAFRPESNFLQRPNEPRFPPQDPRAQNPRFNEQFGPVPPQFRPFEDPRFRSQDPRAPPQFAPPQFTGAERTQEGLRRPEDQRAERPQEGLRRPEDQRPERPEQPPRQGERELSFPPPQGFPQQQQQFGPQFLNFGPQDARSQQPQDPRLAQQQARAELQTHAQPQRTSQSFRGEAASAARGQIDQFLG